MWGFRNKTFIWFNGIYGIFKYYGWCLQQYWWLLLIIVIILTIWSHSQKPFIRRRELNIFLVFTTQSYVFDPKVVILNSTRYLMLEIHNKRQLQNIAINNSGYLIITILRRFTKNEHANYILFWLLILHYQLLISCISESS